MSSFEMIQIPVGDDDGSAKMDAPTRQPKKKTTTKKKPSVVEPPTRPPRPLSGYNLFFKHERERLIDLAKRGEPFREVPPSLVRVSDIRNMVKNIDRGTQKKRAHRKTHGIVGFADMFHIVKRNWKELSPELRAPFEEVAVGEKAAYEIEAKGYKLFKRRELWRRNKAMSRARKNELAGKKAKKGVAEKSAGEVAESRPNQCMETTASVTHKPLGGCAEGAIADAALILSRGFPTAGSAAETSHTSASAVSGASKSFGTAAKSQSNQCIGRTGGVAAHNSKEGYARRAVPNQALGVVRDYPHDFQSAGSVDEASYPSMSDFQAVRDIIWGAPAKKRQKVISVEM